MRGKGGEAPTPDPLNGITPAYAGKSSAQVNVKAVKEDHPRVCGEKVFTRKFFCFKVGSPPRMRGKETKKSNYQDKEGITPAYAGKRLRCFS